MTDERQLSTAEILASSGLPLAEWGRNVLRLSPMVYPHDADLARDLERIVRELVSIDLACIGTDDPSAPDPTATSSEILSYQFRRWPQEQSEFSRAIARVDQLIGRHQVLRVLVGNQQTA